MTITSPDFPPIQQRLAALGFYNLAIDDEWGEGMRDGIDQILDLVERAKGVAAPKPAAAGAPAWPHLPTTYGWLRTIDTLPRHVPIALSLLGTVETPGASDSPIIMGWKKELLAAGIHVEGYSADSVPWCGYFMAYVMMKAERTVVDGPLWALNWGKFGQDGGQPELGDVLTFKRNGGGHVALYIAEDKEGYYHVLGGNQGDKVCISRIQKARMAACRQPPYQNKPASVRPYVVAPSGAVSHNEA